MIYLIIKFEKRDYVESALPHFYNTLCKITHFKFFLFEVVIIRKEGIQVSRTTENITLNIINNTAVQRNTENITPNSINNTAVHVRVRFVIAAEIIPKKNKIEIVGSLLHVQIA